MIMCIGVYYFWIPLYILVYSLPLLYILVCQYTLTHFCIFVYTLSHSCILHSQERIALSLADLVACSCMLTANMLIREAYNGYTKGEKAMLPQLQEFFSTLGLIQRDAVWWIHMIVPGQFRTQPTDYKMCLRKVLFLEPAESYHNRDNWPPESDRK